MDDPSVVPCYDVAFCEETGGAHLLFLDVSDTPHPAGLSAAALPGPV